MKNQHTAQTHCKYGHEFTTENTRIDIRGERVCIICARERARSWARENTGLKGRPKNNRNQNSDKTHCIHGHELAGDNLIFKKSKGKVHRICRKCRNQDSSRRGDLIRRGLDKLDPVRREKYQRRRRKAQLKRVGWSIEKFEQLWEEQQGKCAICGRKITKELNSKHTDKAYADHNHTTIKPREILCCNCNLGIGNLQENIDIMEAAIAYVKKHTQQEG